MKNFSGIHGLKCPSKIRGVSLLRTSGQYLCRVSDLENRISYLVRCLVSKVTRSSWWDHWSGRSVEVPGKICNFEAESMIVAGSVISNVQPKVQEYQWSQLSLEDLGRITDFENPSKTSVGSLISIICPKSWYFQWSPRFDRDLRWISDTLIIFHRNIFIRTWGFENFLD